MTTPTPEFEQMVQDTIDAMVGEGLVTYLCGMGYPTERPQYKHSLKECMCDASCEPHLDEGDIILCLHDGETDHDHCPNAQ